LRNEYLAAENPVLRAQTKGRLLLSDAEKATLTEIAHRLGRKALDELAAASRPDTPLAWYRKLIAVVFLAKDRALETESRSFLNGHEGGNAGYSQGTFHGFTRQRSTLPFAVYERTT